MIAKPITPQGGAGAGLKQSNARQVSTTIGAPPQPPTQPTQPEPQQTPPAQQFAGPVSPYANQPQQDFSDVSQLSDVRSRMLDELFNHDQSLSSKFSPQTQAYIDPLKLEQVATAPQRSNLGLLSSLNTIIGQRQAEALKGPQKLSPAEMKQYYAQSLNEALTADQGQTPLSTVIETYRSTPLSINDIVDTFNTMNPDKQVPLSEAMRYGYRPPTTVNKEQTAFMKAQEGLDYVDKIEKSIGEAKNWTRLAYSIPGLNKLLLENQDVQGRDPIAAYESNRMAYAQELAKKLLSSGYPSSAANLIPLVPSIYDNDIQRERKLSELRATFQTAQGNAQTNVPQFSLAPTGGVNTVAKAPVAPSTAMTPQAPMQLGNQYQTSSGKSYVIKPSVSNTAVNTGGL